MFVHKKTKRWHPYPWCQLSMTPRSKKIEAIFENTAACPSKQKGGKIYWHCPIFICRWIFDIVNFTKTLIPGCGGPDPGHHDGGPGLRLRPQLHQGHDCGGARFQPHRPETGNWFGGWVWPAVEPGRRWDWVPGRHVQLSEPEAGARAEEFQPRHSQRQVCGTRQGDHAGNHNNYINI